MAERTEKPLRKQMKRVRDAFKGNAADVEVELAFNCPVAWESMTPVDGQGAHVRLCGDCDCRVYDLTGKTKSEIVKLIRKNEGTTCGQVQARDDGRVVFGGCTRDENPYGIMRGRLVVQ